MALYDMIESTRVACEWAGATARLWGSHPATVLCSPAHASLARGWGEVCEKSFSRLAARPDWGLTPVTGEDGRDHPVVRNVACAMPFADLVHFDVVGRERPDRKVLLIAPMSGHYATLLRPTVQSLVGECDLWVTDWNNARDIAPDEGRFDVETYAAYIEAFLREIGPGTHVIAVCQPVPLALAAAARMSADGDPARPASLTLMGGPVDPDAARTDVSDFGRRADMDLLERSAIQTVGTKFAGSGRRVYPGSVQISSFMAMNAEKHLKAFSDQVVRASRGESADHDRHNRFYDEYLAVMDMPAEFYISTVERVFKNREIATNSFTMEGRPVDLKGIGDIPMMIVEGEEDDISAPGQCAAALELVNLPEGWTTHHVEPGAGHYGIFAGKAWRNNIRPLVLDFMHRAEDLAGRPSA